MMYLEILFDMFMHVDALDFTQLWTSELICVTFLVGLVIQLFLGVHWFLHVPLVFSSWSYLSKLEVLQGNKTSKSMEVMLHFWP